MRYLYIYLTNYTAVGKSSKVPYAGILDTARKILDGCEIFWGKKKKEKKERRKKGRKRKFFTISPKISQCKKFSCKNPDA